MRIIQERKDICLRGTFYAYDLIVRGEQNAHVRELADVVFGNSVFTNDNSLLEEVMPIVSIQY